MNLLRYVNFGCSVSSVQGKDVKQYGKHNMFDLKADTSWNSSEGIPQWVVIRFEEPQSISKFLIQFQGGFAAKAVSASVQARNGELIVEETFYPEDVNSPQTFLLKAPVTKKEASKMKLLFPSSTDFFGRIIVYKIEIYE
ncbi:PREDICTED: nuclear receptor 2C2-associated protein-like [Rhagoletis zephyria]|uniref:nuclear receptor 2C2-associated protein-like n=1 Tax=Rhagoletis zephyria TaxID=28612 RepID=UPI0008114562|nr:PREDICTED: nuclear receptor 2C2-associated protein-like [Rhagoletis zephyria]XP_017483812.1 PREDICTED: nuclear receptor 2C2-associated protein-like [Rhagoletis zephyria]